MLQALTFSVILGLLLEGGAELVEPLPKPRLGRDLGRRGILLMLAAVVECWVVPGFWFHMGCSAVLSAAASPARTQPVTLHRLMFNNQLQEPADIEGLGRYLT